MGRAIVRQPQAFLMDEPLSNLDAKLRVQMRAEVSKIQHSLNVTTIYVTHDQIEAMTMGDRVAVLSRGVLQQVDTPQNLYDHPRNLFVGAFIGSPQMNLLEATVTRNGDGTTLRVGTSTLTVPESVLAARPSLAGYDGRRVAVGIRPEHLSAAAEGAPDTIKGVIDVREGLGSEVILHMTTDAIGVDTAAAENKVAESDRVVVARVEPHTTAQVGERAVLGVDTRRLHLFDLDSRPGAQLTSVGARRRLDRRGSRRRLGGGPAVARTTSSRASSSTNGAGLVPVASALVRISDPRCPEASSGWRTVVKPL